MNGQVYGWACCAYLEYLGFKVIKTGAMNGFNNTENTCEWHTTRSLRIFISETVLVLVNTFKLILENEL